MIKDYRKVLSNRKYHMYVKTLMLFACVLLLFFYKGKIDAFADDNEDVITTHIWATDYDNNNHWEYCTLCGTIRNIIGHTFEDHWLYGSESCNDTNYSTRICNCGYNYIYRKPHGETSRWYSIPFRTLHYNHCTSCGRWRSSARCYKYVGEGENKTKVSLSCKNPGQCDVCGGNITANTHYLVNPGKCRDCGQQLFSMSSYTLEYAPDYSTATIKFKWTPVMEGVTLTGTMSAYQSNSMFTKVERSHVKNSDGSVEYTNVYTFDKTRQIKGYVNFCDCGSVAKLNNVGLYADSGFYYVPLWQDHEAPIVTNIAQSDQLVHNSWATIKQLEITGTDNLSTDVTITITDKTTGEIIVDKAKTAVVDGKYRYVCTPPLEGPAAGRQYVLTVSDVIGNTLKKDFMIYKTDSKPPVLESDKEYTQWSQTKNIYLDISDYGSAGVQTSMGNQYSYIDAPLVSENLYRLAYKFKDDNYGIISYNLYMRDGLGNATKTVFTVGRVDNTKPTITSLEVKEEEDCATLTVTANDFNEILQAEGSGIKGYALTDDVEMPADNMWQTSNIIKTTKTGRLYLWVKDVAGNIADVKKINISESFIVDIKKEDLIIYDGAKKAVEKTVKDVSELGKTVNENVTKDKLVHDNKNFIKTGQMIDNNQKVITKTNDVIKEYDDTPNTKDDIYIYLYLYIGLAFMGSVTILIMEIRRKKLVQNENK